MKQIALFCCCIASMLQAKDFGRRGHEFPIEEENLADYLGRTAGQGAEQYLAAMQEEIWRPESLDLPLSQEERTYFVDLPGFEMEMLFFDGDDPRQVAWAKEQGAEALWILVKGAPAELEEQERRDVFFDQMGFYSSRLQIQHIPAKAVAARGGASVTEAVMR